MPEFEIRPALESESAQIKDLIHMVGINPMGLDWRRFLVAVEGSGRVVGCGQVKPHGEDILELASIAVPPEFRGRGIARRIIETLLAQNPRPLYLMCVSHNGPMYEKFGFRVLDGNGMPKYFRRIKNLFDAAKLVRRTDEDLLVMKLE
ncbi:MAG: GNAT family N-acetyltransferase [Anaerolineales bacterium]|jgi:N-acetylglutamate synthase-like GNAT family acetyltransferase|nr:GNAT family N-acetyltransferase [Chloroflexota bacterium]MBK6645693.1 GNAT family N-acetyltransferase [Anaerolineales bacterium]MCC6986856.1 GNAT family N-acetyltransferase [Anaerolineales bacterium]